MHCSRWILCLLLLMILPFQAAAQEIQTCTPFPMDAPAHARPDTTFDVTHATLSLVMGPGGAATGHAAFEMRVTTATDSLVIQLADGQLVDSVVIADTAYVDVGETRRVRIALPDTLSAGSELRASVHYRATLRFSAPDVVSTADPVGVWFPLASGPHDRFTTELEITAPGAWAVAATGVPTGQVSAEANALTHRFSSPQDLPARRIAFIAGDVDSGTLFASLAAGRRLPVAWWMPRQRASDRPRDAASAAEAAAARLSFYSTWTGFPLPFDRYTQLHVDGTAHASVGLARIPPAAEPDDREAAPYIPPPSLTSPIVAQWFGGLVSAASWHDVWLEEAFAAYLGTFDAGTSSPSLESMARLRDVYLANREGRPLLWDRWNHPAELLGRAAAARGAWVLHQLRQDVGAEAFREAVNLFLTWHQFRSITTTDWLRAAEAVSEADLLDFFGTWIHEAGHPELAVSYESDGDVLRLRIEQFQEGEHVPDVYDLGLALEVGALGSTERFDVRLDERVASFELPFAGTPRFVAVDPEMEWLLETRVDQPAQSWVAQLRHASTGYARRAAAEALRDSAPDPALLLGLRAALDEEPEPRVRRAIVQAIGSLPHSEAAERALSASYDDPSPDVRAAVLAALGDTATAEASALALRAAESDPSYAVQAEGVRSLARMGAANAVDVARAALVTPSHDDVIRAAGLEAFGILYDRAPEEALEEALAYTDPSQPARLREAGAHLLAESSSTAATNRLAELLGDPDPSVARAAAAAMRASGRTSVLVERIDEISAPAVRAAVASTVSCEAD